MNVAHTVALVLPEVSLCLCMCVSFRPGGQRKPLTQTNVLSFSSPMKEHQ